jgi:hypothetical protein
VIHVTNTGAGFSQALAQAELVAKYKNLPDKSKLHLQLLTEEMMGMMHALTGEKEADFWIDDENGEYALHLKVETLMNAEMRKNLLSASKSGTNVAAKGFSGKLRDLFERIMEPTSDSFDADMLIGMDYAYTSADFGGLSTAMAGMWSLQHYRMMAEESGEPKEKWDELEKSVIARLADDVKIGIAGQNVEMIIIKKF